MNMLLESSRMGITAECYQHPAVTNHIAVGGHMTSAHNTTSLVQPVTVFPTSKVCSKCHTDKPFSEFYRSNDGKFGIHSQCKPCMKIACQANYAKNKEARKVAQQAYIANLSPERIERRALSDVRSGMKSRCYAAKHVRHADWGGRGITVCQRWLASLDAFIEDMGPRPTPKHQLDRIDNDGNYEPSNCRWVTPAENCQNRRVVRHVRSDSKTGIAGVTLTRSGSYASQLKRHGIIHQKTFKQRWDAICHRKSLENQFNRGLL